MTSRAVLCSAANYELAHPMALRPRRLPSTFTLAATLPVASWFIIRPLLDPAPPLPSLFTSVGFSIIAFLVTLHLIPAVGPLFIKAGLRGKDKAKVYDDDM